MTANEAKHRHALPATEDGAGHLGVSPGRMFLRHAAMATAFNLVIALFIAMVLHTGKQFRNDFVFSMCIGTAAWLIIDIGRILLWRNGPVPKGKFFLLTVAAAPPAFYLGIMAGAALLGYDPGRVLPPSMTAALASVAFTLSMMLLAAWLFWNWVKMAEWKAQVAQQQAQAAIIQKQAMQAQLQLLQTQIEPHMLFNTLANLQGLITVDPPRAQAMLDQLIQYLRATLASSRAQATTLAQEFALMDAYLGLMSVRMGERLGYALKLPADLRTLPMPPMLLQPLIENAIRHGLEPKIGGGRIDVAAERRDGALVVTVTDTGLGIDADGMALNSTAGTGIGLANIRDRLQALYGDAARLSLVRNQPSGVIAQLTLPLAP